MAIQASFSCWRGVRFLGLLPQRVAGPFERPGVAAGTAGTTAVERTAGLLPGLAADLVECLGRPRDHVEGVGAAHRVLATVAHHSSDPVGGIGGNVGDVRAAVLAEKIEEGLQGLVVAAGPCPHQPAAVVIDYHGEVAVAALVADLVDPYAAQASEAVDGGGDVGTDAANDGADGAPRHAH